MATYDDFAVPRQYWEEGAAPATPPSGQVVQYAKADGLLYQKDDAGTETVLAGSGSGIATTLADDAGDTLVASAADTWAKRKNNPAASVAPAVTDDSGDGYAIGSRWYDTTADKEYVALDVSVGAAVWKETTAAGGGGFAHAFATVATDEGTTSTSFGDLATAGPAVTITVNTAVKVTISADMYGSSAGCSMNMGVAMSGANTLAAQETQKLLFRDESTNGGQFSRVIYLSGLTPGSTTFTTKYYHSGSGTSHWRYRQLLVECLD